MNELENGHAGIYGRSERSIAVICQNQHQVFCKRAWAGSRRVKRKMTIALGESKDNFSRVENERGQAGLRERKARSAGSGSSMRADGDAMLECYKH